MVHWKKSGRSCPRCDQETEVLVGSMADYNGVSSAERCWRCGWVAGFDKNGDQTQSRVLSYDSEHKKVAALAVSKKGNFCSRTVVEA